MQIRVTATTITLVLSILVINQELYGEEFVCHAARPKLSAFRRQALVGDTGHKIERAMLVDDWIVAVVTEAVVSNTKAPFVWGSPIEKERFAFIICHNIKTYAFRTLELPESLLIDSTTMRIRRCGSGVVRISIVRNEPVRTQREALVEFDLEKNAIQVKHGTFANAVAEIATFFDVKTTANQASFDLQLNPYWSMLDGAGWLQNTEIDRQTYVQRDSFSNELALFSVSEGTFSISTIDLATDKTLTCIQSRESLRSLFPESDVQQIVLPHFVGIHIKSLTAGLVLDSHKSICLTMGGTAHTEVEVGVALGGFSEIDNLTTSANGLYTVVEGRVDDASGVSIVKIADLSDRFITSLHFDASFGDEHTNSLFAVTDDGNQLFFFDSNSVSVYDTRKLSYVKSYAFLDVDPGN